MTINTGKHIILVGEGKDEKKIKRNIYEYHLADGRLVTRWARYQGNTYPVYMFSAHDYYIVPEENS